MYNFCFSSKKLLNEKQIKSFNERVPYINSKIVSCSYKEKKFKLFFFKTIDAEEKNKIIYSCKKLIARIKLINTVSDEKIIFENNIKVFKKKNLFSYLEKKKFIKNISSGIFTLRGEFLEYFYKLDSFLIKKSKHEKYENVHVQSALPLESFLKNGYLENFPQHLMFVSNIKRDIKILDKSASLKKNSIRIKDITDHANLILSPTVCHHIFETLKNSTIKNNKVFNSISSCNRFESINYNTLERLQSFTMREYIGFGSLRFIKKFLHNNIDFFKRIFIQNKIKFRIATANDAFFSEQGIKRMAFQSLNDLKFEFQFWLPNEKKWLSVGSFNNHLDILINKYNIKSKNRNLYSGCIGWGYERFVYAIMSQKISQINFLK